MNKIVQILMERDDLTQKEAEEALLAAQLEIKSGADPEEILYEDFGLEPDYIMDLVY